MKTIFTYLVFFISITIFSQVGVGTTSPHRSAALDISSTSQGIRFPMYELTNLKDFLNPIYHPKEGLVIYNNGTHHPQGYYVWIENQWHSMINQEQISCILFATIPTGITDNGQDVNHEEPNLLTINTTDNEIQYMQLLSTNKPEEAGLDPDNKTLFLPAGKYKVIISGDVSRRKDLGTGTTGLFQGVDNKKYYYRSYNTYLKDVDGNLLAPPQMMGKIIRASWTSYSFIHYIDLAEPTHFNVYWDTEPDSNIGPLQPRSGISVIAYELKE